MKPIKSVKGIIICFEAEPEDRTMAQHFMGECGWSSKEVKKLKGSAWFCAKVSAWKDGEELAAEYLGACCYKNEDDFWQEEGGYFDDMVKNLLETPIVKAITFKRKGSLGIEQLAQLLYIDPEEKTLCWRERTGDSKIYEWFGERYRATRNLFNSTHANTYVGAPTFLCGGYEYNTEEVAKALAAYKGKK